MNITEPKSLSGFFYFDPEDGIYGDHFPGNPVVPGSLIIYAFQEVLRQSGYGDRREVRKFRFAHFLCPGTYAYEITPMKAGFLCRLFGEKKEHVTGEIR